MFAILLSFALNAQADEIGVKLTAPPTEGLEFADPPPPDPPPPTGLTGRSWQGESKEADYDTVSKTLASHRKAFEAFPAKTPWSTGPQPADEVEWEDGVWDAADIFALTEADAISWGKADKELAKHVQKYPYGDKDKLGILYSIRNTASSKYM